MGAVFAETSNHLEQVYWIAQIVLVGVAVWAGHAAYRQWEAFNLFELLKYAQGETFRQARRRVIREIRPLGDQRWWESDETLEASAADCCAHYDVLGRVLMRRSHSRLVGFLDPWGPSIMRTYPPLLRFIEERRARGGPDFKGYEWLYEKARLRLGKAGINVT